MTNTPTQVKWSEETFEFEYFPQNTTNSKESSFQPVRKVFHQWLKEDSKCLTDGAAQELEKDLTLHLRLRPDSKIYLLRGGARCLFHGPYPGVYKVFVIQPSVDVPSSIVDVHGALVLCQAVLTAKKEGDTVNAEWQLLFTITPPKGYWQDSITAELIGGPLTELVDFSPLNEERTLVVTNTTGFQAQLSGQAKLSPTPAQLTGGEAIEPSVSANPNIRPEIQIRPSLLVAFGNTSFLIPMHCAITQRLFLCVFWTLWTLADLRKCEILIWRRPKGQFPT